LSDAITKLDGLDLTARADLSLLTVAANSATERASWNGKTIWAAIQSEADSYIKSLSGQRSLLGAYQNQMEYTLSNITELSANLSASKSRVIDTDYASETASLTRGQILQQAATAMLAQANQMPNVILTLLK
jgi:flagellin